MMQVRALIIQSAGKKLAHACTIGIRYIRDLLSIRLLRKPCC